ncbi:PAAR domain-containing protein [Curvibacter sp. RS43]|uniref:RHS repeat-associated core domain-containing protein n=1 Tax=Curvibacter microcysteis TaxID=3026419 RepID=UPI00235E163C|nr:PAAR domain-containing protein [Curvibacter sp. RS43]MDD0808738.1 PAAR domain-containing protein [Curvibacter sp. RS43]
MAQPAARQGDIAKHKGEAPAPILEGSPNVLINGLPAARMGDKSKHRKTPEAIIEGSGSVKINGQAAARVDDKVACGQVIISGSGNVFIGDGSDGKACSVCPGGVAVGKPVNPLLGAKVLFGPEELDFVLPGAHSVAWQRHYSSYVGPAGQVAGLLGYGWRLPFEMHLTLDAQHTRLFDSKNRVITFAALAPGEQSHSLSEGFTLMRGGVLVDAAPTSATTSTTTPKPGSSALSQAKTQPVPWAQQDQWSHIPAQWKTDPHYLLAATEDRTVFLFAALDLEPHDNTAWRLIAIRDILGRQQTYHRYIRRVFTDKSIPKDLPHGSLLRIEDPHGRCCELVYTQLSWLAKKPTPDDNCWRLSAVQLNATTLVSYQYQGGDLCQVTDRHGRSTRTFEYDAQHRITRHRVLGGPWARYTYASADPAAKVVHHAIEDGLSFQFDYQASQTVVTDSLGRSTTYGFTGSGGRQRLTHLIDALGQRTDYAYTLDGHLVQERNPLGQYSRYQRDAQGKVTQVTAPDGSQTHMRWQGNNLISLSGPDGQTTRFEYDRYGRQTRVTDPLGHSTTYSYPDPRATAPQANQQANPQALIAEHPIRITDAKGGVKTLAWTAYGRLQSDTDCSRQTTRYAYNAWGEVTAVTNALGQTLRYTRDALGRVTTITYPDHSPSQRGQVSQPSQLHCGYDAQGQLRWIKDAQGQLTEFERDRHGRVTRSTTRGTNPSNGVRYSPPPHTLSYQYDAAGRLTQLTNENGAHTRFGYDKLDRLIEETGFDGRTQRYEYNAIGLLLQAHDSASAQPDAPTLSTEYTYTPGNRLHTRTVAAMHRGPAGPQAAPPSGTEANLLFERVQHHFAYDKAGQLIQATTPSASVRLQRDALGRVTSESLHIAGRSADSPALHTHSVQHRYDELGQLSASRYPLAGEVDYLSYGSGHVHQILLNKEPLIDLERDALHREIQRKLYSAAGPAQAVQVRLRHDAMGRLVRAEVFGGPSSNLHGNPSPNTAEPTVGGLSRSYEYDAIGQLSAIAKPGGLKTHYTYDLAHRLVYAQDRQHREAPGLELFGIPPHSSTPVPGSAQQWHFDAAGNRLTEASTHSLYSAPSSVPNNRITRDEHGHRYEYDAWGNVARISHANGQETLLRYDGLHQLRASRSYNPQAPEHEQCTEVHYEYDALGRRYHKRSVRPTPDGPSQTLKTTWYGWDGDRLVTTQTNTQTDELTDERTSSTLYEPNSFVPMIRIDTTNQKTRKADGPQEEETHQSKAFYHCNHLGTPLALIDVETAKIIWQAEFDPWGLVKSQYNPHHMDQPIRMQGQQRDQETGLFYNRYRYYVPQMGRYVTQDPVGLVGGINIYLYVDGNPPRYYDPLGLDPWARDNTDPWYPLESKPPFPSRPDGQPWGWGCGDKDTDHRVPDVVGGVNIILACRKHDECYDNAGKPGASKAQCDQSFKADIYSLCRQAGRGDYYCKSLSYSYFKGVDVGGSDAWNAAKGVKP